MRRVLGPRIVVEAAFLVAVPAVALAVGAHWPAIVGASAVAYLLVLLVEAALAHDRSAGARARGGLRGSRAQAGPAATSAQPPEPEPQPAPPSRAARRGVRERVGLGRGSRPEASDEAPAPEAAEHVHVVPAAQTEPEPGPVPRPEAEPEPEPVATAEPPAEEPVSEAPPEPEPEPAAPRPPLAAVPPLPPEPEPDFEPEPAAVAPEPTARVVPIGVGGLPRQWNVWDLERLAREHAGSDVFRDEEWTYLLLYLRDFADPSGMLPVDFDELVRDSFGELVGAR